MRVGSIPVLVSEKGYLWWRSKAMWKTKIEDLRAQSTKMKTPENEVDSNSSCENAHVNF